MEKHLMSAIIIRTSLMEFGRQKIDDETIRDMATVVALSDNPVKSEAYVFCYTVQGGMPLCLIIDNILSGAHYYGYVPCILYQAG